MLSWTSDDRYLNRPAEARFRATFHVKPWAAGDARRIYSAYRHGGVWSGRCGSWSPRRTTWSRLGACGANASAGSREAAMRQRAAARRPQRACVRAMPPMAPTTAVLGVAWVIVFPLGFVSMLRPR